MSSFSHESIINECKLTGKYLDKNKIKNKLSMMLLDKKLSELKDAKDNILHTLYYSQRPITDEEENHLQTDLENMTAKIEDTEEELIELYDQECINDNLTEDIKNAISTTKVASLSSFQSRNPPTTKKVLSDPYMFKNITSYNTGLGGKSRKYKSTKKRTRKTRKTRRTGKRKSTKSYKS